MTSRRPVFSPNLSAFAGLLLIAALAAPLPLVAAAKVTAHTGQIILPTYPWVAVKHPYFRGTDKVNIYPYPMLDFLSREKTNRTYRTVVLDNEYLRITFLPELGGRIHDVIDKTTGQPMFYVNHVIKPGLIGQCGAWISGGVEWNTGPQGHTVSAMQPVPVVILSPEKDGSRSVAIGETERIYGTKWTVVVTLRPGRSFIEERIRIYNPTEYVRPYYFWNCTAVPNTPGFRFIYPMTLGTDHGSEKFFNWPTHEGKDLSRGTNYEDASSIFAWHCDQDFFGSYDDGADRGVVSYANHHQVPGKKAWTWGQGGFGKMHQMDLTDSDGPYNEVQTGPLLTQGEVGRLDPCEAVEWKEWWYPVHGIGGFTFANKDVAVNAALEGSQLRLRMVATEKHEEVRVSADAGKMPLASTKCGLSPQVPTQVSLDLGKNRDRVIVDIGRLARFEVPLRLAKRTPPAKRESARTASDFAQAGWEDYQFAKFPDAEARFRKSLTMDTNCVAALTGLAYLNLDRNPPQAVKEAEAALALNPDHGLARYALAVAKSRGEGIMMSIYMGGADPGSLDDAWKAALDPATAVPGRALVAKCLLDLGSYHGTVQALADPGPWATDSVCRNRLALALVKLGEKEKATDLAKANLELDPLDLFARSVLWLADSEEPSPKLTEMLTGRPESVLDLVADYIHLGHARIASQLLIGLYCARVPQQEWDPMVAYWANHFRSSFEVDEWPKELRLPASGTTRKKSSDSAFPYRYESTLPFIANGGFAEGGSKCSLSLGHLLFHLGRHTEGRKMWEKAAILGAEPVIAYRALGMAAKTLDGNLKAAREWLEKANQADPQDAIVARDLAKVLFELADKADDPAKRRALWSGARDTLKTSFAQGKGRADFVSLLGRAQNRLGEYAETARMLDQVRVTVWEGSREVHDLFEDAHIELGQAHLASRRAEDALAEFNRALEYPENLATGKLENTREAHIHYLRGNALMALDRKQAALEAWRKAADEPSSKDAAREEARRKARQAIEKAGP